QRLEAVAHFRHRLVLALDHREHLQGCDEAVAGGGVVGQDDVAGRLAADVVALRAHLLDHVTVADRRAHEAQALRGEMPLETEIRDHGRDDARILQAAVFLPALGDDGEQLVAVDDMPALVDDEHAVGVAVERNADVGAHLAHLARQRVEIGRAAVLVDVEAVRIDADRNDLGAELPQRAWRDLVGGAVGAIDDDTQIFESDAARQRALGEFDVTVLHAVDAAGAAEVLAAGQLLAEIGIEQRLDLQLHLVAELVAVRPEDLDAVVVERIVRGGDHDAEVGAHRVREHGDAGRRHRAGQEHVHTDRGEASDQRVLDHVAGEAGVFADQHAMAVIAIAEDQPGRLPDLEREFRRDDAVGTATNAVGAEIATNHVYAPYHHTVG